MDGPPTPFSYENYEAYFRTPEPGNIDDALAAPEINPDTNFPSGYNGEPYNANPRVEWTYSEKEIFQITLAELGFNRPRLFEEISARIPGKTADQVKEHFDALVQAEHIQIPVQETEGATSSGGTSQGRQKWTDEEHGLFLRGLAQYGKGEWKRISSDFVTTKTPSQVSSHAQKYYNRINNTTPPLRRRFSINDTRIVDSTIVHYPARPL